MPPHLNTYVPATTHIGWAMPPRLNTYVPARPYQYGLPPSALPQVPSLLQVLGLRTPGLVPAATHSLLLVAALFLGPLLLPAWAAVRSRGCSGVLAPWPSPGPPAAWLAALLASARRDEALLVWRNLVVAPATEEFVFRACMAPLLLLSVRHALTVRYSSCCLVAAAACSPEEWQSSSGSPLHAYCCYCC